MKTTLHVNSHFLLANYLSFLNPASETNSHVQRVILQSKSPIFHSFSALSQRTEIKTIVVCARRKKRRSGSQKSAKFIINFMALLVHNLKILPWPLDLLVSEMGGGDEGGTGLRRGFGRWGGFDWWKRKGEGIIGFWVVLVSCSLCFRYWKELKTDKLLLVLGINLSGAAFIKLMKIKFKMLLFGFCCLGTLLGIGLKRENFMKWVKEIRVSSSNLASKRRGKRNCSRGF